jgi:MFS family permease
MDLLKLDSMVKVDSRIDGFYYGWVIIAAFFTMWTVVFGIQYSFGIFFKSLQDALGCSRGTISWAITIHTIVCALVTVPAGWAIDRYNSRIIYFPAAFVFGLPLALCSQVSAPWQLYFLYGLMGIGGGIYGPSFYTVITRWFTEKRGLAMGLAVAGVGFGALVVPPLTNELISSYGWRNAFFILGLASVIIFFVCTLCVRNQPEPASDKTQSAADTSAASNQARRSDPLPTVTFGQAIRTKEFMFIVAAATSAQLATKMVVVHIAPHATDMGISPFMAAMALSTIGFGSFLGRVAMGFVQDRIGAQRSLIICLSTLGVCMFALPFITVDVAFFVFAILFGLSYGGDIPQVPSITVQCFGIASMGVIYAFISGTVALLSSIGPFAAGYIFDVTHSYTIAFLGTSVLLFLGVFSVSRIK